MKYDKLIKEKLPKWAIIEKDEKGNDFIVVQAEVVYPIFLKILEYPEKNPNQTQLETCRFCFTEFLKKRIIQKYMDDFTPLALRIKSEPDKKWALKNFDPGKSAVIMDKNKKGIIVNLQGWHKSEYLRIAPQIK